MINNLSTILLLLVPTVIISTTNYHKSNHSLFDDELNTMMSTIKTTDNYHHHHYHHHQHHHHNQQQHELMSLYLAGKNFTESTTSGTIIPELHMNLTIIERFINIVNDNAISLPSYPDRQISATGIHGSGSGDDQFRRIDRLVEMSYTFRTVMVVIYMLTAFVAFIANIMAILILNYGRRTSRQLNLFLSNLGLSDIIFAIFNIPFTYITLIYNTWWLPEFLCPLTSFVQVLAPTVAFYTLIAIGIGRYYVIVTGQESLFLTKSSHTKLVIAFIWIMSCFVASPILIATKISPVIYVNETYVECTEDWSFLDPTNSHSIGTIYTIIVFVMTFILPVVALTYLYGHIGLIVYKHKFPEGNDNRVTNQNLTQTKVKVLKMLLLLVISFIICWSPCQIFYLMLWIFEDIRQDPNAIEMDDNDDVVADAAATTASYYSIIYYSIYFISHWLACSHTIMNPFIYCFCSNNFQMTDLADIICCKINRRDSWMNRSMHSHTNNNNNNNNNHNKKMIKFSSSYRKSDQQQKWSVEDSPPPTPLASPMKLPINDSFIMLKPKIPIVIIIIIIIF
nr:QRFP-like peptide receptor [Dermatophagoides farinae]